MKIKREAISTFANSTDSPEKGVWHSLGLAENPFSIVCEIPLRGSEKD